MYKKITVVHMLRNDLYLYIKNFSYTLRTTSEDVISMHVHTRKVIFPSDTIILLFEPYLCHKTIYVPIKIS